jgi:hypothetical protein
MTVADAQREVRHVFLGGFAGQLVTGVLWAISAALGTWRSPRLAMLFIVIGGFFIFPLTQLLLSAMGRRPVLSRENPFGQLATQIAFTVPMSLPLVGAATLHHRDWFYPALMIVIGAHYLPFCFLYGMWEFSLLCAALVGGGLVFGLYLHVPFSLGGWVSAGVLLLFAFVGRARALRETRGVRV